MATAYMVSELCYDENGSYHYEPRVVFPTEQMANEYIDEISQQNPGREPHLNVFEIEARGFS